MYNLSYVKEKTKTTFVTQFSNSNCFHKKRTFKSFEIIFFYIYMTANSFWQRNWVFGTNSDLIIPISLQPNVVDLRSFKLWILLHQIILVWNIKSLKHQFSKIWGSENLSLWQRLNSLFHVLLFYSGLLWAKFIKIIYGYFVFFTKNLLDSVKYCRQPSGAKQA